MTSDRTADRIYLSPPHMSEEGFELELVQEAFRTNWIAPVGPHLTAFEEEFAEYVGAAHAVAVASGTSALHLALRLLGVQPGDEVLCSTLTFIASANPIVYEGARPVFVDSDEATWNIDPELLGEELDARAKAGTLPRAVIVVDLLGQCADYDRIQAVCEQYEVPIVEDAAEALGSTYRGTKAGTFGVFGAFSFNGNKIITTSGGGMLVTSRQDLAERARHLSTQARKPGPHFEHSELGYNYRMSNVCAAIGRGQLRVLDRRIARRRRIWEYYTNRLGDVPGVDFMPIADYGSPNFWLTALTIDPERFGTTRDAVIDALQEQRIEARPLWMPLHRQPVYAGVEVRGGRVSERLFSQGMCLPSGSALEDEDLERISDIVLASRRRG